MHIEPSPTSVDLDPARKPAPRSGTTTRVVAALLLGLVTTVAVAWGLAAFLGLDVRARFTNAIGPGGAGSGAATSTGLTVMIGSDGDHLLPWHLVLERPGARREIWFEKGRVYGPQSVAAPSARSAAVACWSFATDCRSAGPTRTVLEPDREIAELTQSPTPLAWGAAIDRRGWPLPCLQGRVIGVMNSQATSPWKVDQGIDIDGVGPVSQPVPALSGTGQGMVRSANLATIRVLPTRPLWGGMAFNLLLYAGVWYVLLGIPLWLLSRWRTAKGCCRSCGYDLSGLTHGLCPECGAATTAANTAKPPLA